MREYYAPHHPRKIIVMMENGWFDQVLALVGRINGWMRKGNRMEELYEIVRMGDYYFAKEHRPQAMQSIVG